MKSIIDIMKQRRSVRNYELKTIDNETIDKINSYIAILDNPFSTDIRFKILPTIHEVSNVKLGAYGMIKNPPTFIVAANNGSEISKIAIGYALEKIVLYCTSLGLGTCWIAGTFNRNSFSKSFELLDNEKLFAVTPLGYPSGKRGLMEKLIRSDSKHASRKPFEEIFFLNDWNTPLSQSNAGEYSIPLEMVRIAPSAMNKQPWKLLIQDNQIAFYHDNSVPSFKVDIGIAMCHFDLACNELGITGKFENNKNSQKECAYEYIMSWTKTSN